MSASELDDNPGPEIIGYNEYTLNVLLNVTHLDPSSVYEASAALRSSLQVIPFMGNRKVVWEGGIARSRPTRWVSAIRQYFGLLPGSLWNTLACKVLC